MSLRQDCEAADKWAWWSKSYVLSFLAAQARQAVLSQKDKGDRCLVSAAAMGLRVCGSAAAGDVHGCTGGWEGTLDLESRGREEKGKDRKDQGQGEGEGEGEGAGERRAFFNYIQRVSTTRHLRANLSTVFQPPHSLVQQTVQGGWQTVGGGGGRDKLPAESEDEDEDIRSHDENHAGR
ncbi:hypothetical protein CkaCkLH20_08119 [Colletotrichum karsti]|uniref:Uncharacterized protein n=1 Tax=Colletotrichum karsti TaxID=1095194 RepID=A0A9P6I408_9PEZI|nr:uncharacterized protein CkaCkLH20_08119 [Colletotrichum karsti]KAF9874556.1 hypothetical protein CkaCkLH20_08119 [Colletotrichum karsti]